MAQRTTTTLVEARLAQDWAGGSVQQDIDAASLITDRVASCASMKGVPLTTAELEMTERLLACHIYKYAADRQFSGVSVQGSIVNGQFTGQTGLNLDGTTYGQMAQMMDYSGCLTAIAKRQFGRLVWLGLKPSEQTPVWNRD